MMASSSSWGTPSLMPSQLYHREVLLRDAKIYIDTLLPEEQPEEVNKLSSFLTNDHFRGTIKESQVNQKRFWPGLRCSLGIH